MHTDTVHGDHPLAVIVDKHRQQISLYRFKKRWHTLARWNCSTGKIQGRKATEGDKRTPEGIYFVTRDVGAQFLNETYGSRALPLDYPNWLDRRMRRSGSAIWIHGTNKPLKPYDSNGCVVMDNSAIAELASHLTIMQTPVIIVDRLERSTSKKLRAESRLVLSALKRWQHALIHGSFDVFKQSYAPEAQPSMAWWRQWCRQRRRHAIEAPHHSSMRQRSILREGATYVVLFDHYLTTASHEAWVGRRKLHLAMTDGRIAIIGDTYLSRGHLGRTPLLHAWKKLWASEQPDPSMAAGEKRSSET